MKRTNRLTALLVCLCLVLGLFAGCGSREPDQVELTLNFANYSLWELLDRLGEVFPDITIRGHQYEGSSGSSYLYRSLITGHASDIFFYTTQLSDEDAKAHLLDLSGYDFVSKYDTSMQNTFAVDGGIYQLPGPVSVRCMVYNKTIFDRHGWKAPASHEELLALCAQIRAESDLTPIAMSMGAVGYPFTTVTTLSQAGSFSTPDGMRAERSYMAGTGSIGACFDEGLDMTGELIDAGAFDPEKYLGVWDGSVISEDFAAGKAAMLFMWAGQNTMLEVMENSEYTFELLPFYGRNPGEEVLGINTNFTWGLSDRLAEKGNEKKLEAALRVMDWLSSVEAQSYLVSGKTEIFTLKNADNTTTASFYDRLWRLSQEGQKAFMVYPGYEDVIVEAGQVVWDAMVAGSSEGMKAGFIRVSDELHRATLASPVDTDVGSIGQDLNEAETAQMAANLALETGLGDFVLMTHSGTAENRLSNKWGVAGDFPAGGVSVSEVMILRPSGGSRELDVLSLTGGTVRKLLEEGRVITDEADPAVSAAWPYYWAGIDVTMKKGKVTSVKWKGEALEEDEVYRVIFINGDYDAALTESAAVENTGVPLLDLFQSRLETGEPVMPPEVLRK